jgi:hypothetical protein
MKLLDRGHHLSSGQVIHQNDFFELFDEKVLRMID